jgi:hypothetical protein
MSKLWMGNIAPGTSEEEVKAFLAKYGMPAVISVQHVADDGARPAAVVEVAAAPEVLQRITGRLNGMYWKGRSLTVQPMMR